MSAIRLLQSQRDQGSTDRTGRAPAKFWIKRATDQENFQNADQGGPRTNEIKKSCYETTSRCDSKHMTEMLGRSSIHPILILKLDKVQRSLISDWSCCSKLA